jgi:DNA invertase Pin-like site-specific DNA recombinase
LANRAQDLGWRHVEIIDTDLGRSAAIGMGEREGFERLIASVAMGEVGIVLSREVSRLSRTDKDWCHLFEVCQVFGTLIGDAEQIYDLDMMDDQLVLGIKATLSIVELKVLKMRMLQGMEEKARRGELRRLLPVGYVWDPMGRVVKDPDQRIQEAMELVLRKFRELRSGRQTFLWFRTHEVELPVNKSQGGRMRVVWQLPTNCFIHNVLRNPYYAGAYVWGRRETVMAFEGGKLKKRYGKIRSAEHCRVYLRDHHEGYITWETFEGNLRILRGNDMKGASDESVGPVRAGQGLLAGLLRCGRCGRKLHVRYWGRSGTAARYLCKGAFGGGGGYCLGFGGRLVDERFCQELLEVISPLGVQASLMALERLRAEDQDQRQALVRKLQHCEYETRRAFEQYNEVDPRHRLVASELERRWNEKLDELGQLRSTLAEMDAAAWVLGDREQERILALGKQFREVWESDQCPVEIIRQMAPRYGDDEIARVLNKLDRRTGKGRRWNAQRVATAGSTYSIAGHSRSAPDPEILSLGRAAKHCGVSQGTIMRMVNSGVLNKHQVVPWAPWEIKRSELDSVEVQQVLTRLRQTGKLATKEHRSSNQMTLF